MLPGMQPAARVHIQATGIALGMSLVITSAMPASLNDETRCGLWRLARH